MKFAYKVNMYNYLRWLMFSIFWILFFARCNSLMLTSESMFSIFLILLSPMSRTSRVTNLSTFYIFFILFADKKIFFKFTNPSREPSGTSLITLNAKSKMIKLERWLRFSIFVILLSYNSSSMSSLHVSIPSIFLIKFFRRPSFYTYKINWINHSTNLSYKYWFKKMAVQTKMRKM